MPCTKPIGMTEKGLFTRQEVWKGGHYELFIRPLSDSSEELCSILKALWSFPSLDGCYLRRDCEPSLQERVKPCENNVAGHLYGLAKVHDSVVACGSHTMDYPGEEGYNAARRISFYLPLGALGEKFPVGAYPFGPMDRVSAWKADVDSLLVEIAKWVHAKSVIRLALVGFELNVAAVAPATIQANGIPKERDEGILWDDGSGLKWYPATRP